MSKNDLESSIEIIKVYADSEIHCVIERGKIMSTKSIHELRKPILALAKEVKESSDIEEIATLVSTYEWIVVAVSRNKTFCLIRIA